MIQNYNQVIQPIDLLAGIPPSLQYMVNKLRHCQIRAIISNIEQKLVRNQPVFNFTTTFNQQVNSDLFEGFYMIISRELTGYAYHPSIYPATYQITRSYQNQEITFLSLMDIDQAQAFINQ